MTEWLEDYYFKALLLHYSHKEPLFVKTHAYITAMFCLKAVALCSMPYRGEREERASRE